MRTNLTRRALLASSPALAVAAATPSLAQSEASANLAFAPFAGDTPIQAAFREWVAYERWLNNEMKGVPDEEFNDLVSKSTDMAERIGEMETTCPEDFAAKYLALTTFGNGTLNGEVYDWEATLAEEAAALLGSTVSDMRKFGLGKAVAS